MVQQIAQITVFIAGTSEVQDDVGKVEETIELYSDINKNQPIRFTVSHWRKHSVGQVGSDPQAAINTQLLRDDQFDIMFAILGSSVGSKTPRSESGTIEEIEIARKKDGTIFRNQHVHVLFKEISTSILEVDMEALSELRAFRDSIKLNTLYIDYGSDEELKDYILRALQSIVDNYSKGQLALPPDSQRATSSPIAQEGDIALDPGFLDYQQLFEEGIAASVNSLNEIGVIFGELNQIFTDNHRLETIRNPEANARDKKRIIDELGLELSHAAVRLKEAASETQARFVEALDAFRKGIVLQAEDHVSFGTEEEQSIFEEVTSNMLNEVAQLRDIALHLNQTITSLPRATGQFNRGKKKMLLSNADIVRMTSEIAAQVGEATGVVRSLSRTR